MARERLQRACVSVYIPLCPDRDSCPKSRPHFSTASSSSVIKSFSSRRLRCACMAFALHRPFETPSCGRMALPDALAVSLDVTRFKIMCCRAYSSTASPRYVKASATDGERSTSGCGIFSRVKPPRRSDSSASSSTRGRALSFFFTGVTAPYVEKHSRARHRGERTSAGARRTFLFYAEISRVVTSVLSSFSQPSPAPRLLRLQVPSLLQHRLRRQVRTLPPEYLPLRRVPARAPRVLARVPARARVHKLPLLRLLALRQPLAPRQ